MEKLLEAEMTNHLGHERRKGASSRPYGPGMSTRDIQAHLRELYGTDVSHELISKATEGVLELLREWQSRAPLSHRIPGRALRLHARCRPGQQAGLLHRARRKVHF